MKIVLPLPPTLNQIRRAGVTRRGRIYTYKTKKARGWENEAMWLLKKAKGRKRTIKGDVEIFITLKLKRDRDIDASQKLLFDCLERAGLIENDRQIIAMHVFKEKGKGEMEIILTEIEE